MSVIEDANSNQASEARKIVDAVVVNNHYALVTAALNLQSVLDDFIKSSEASTERAELLNTFAQQLANRAAAYAVAKNTADTVWAAHRSAILKHRS